MQFFERQQHADDPLARSLQITHSTTIGSVLIASDLLSTAILGPWVPPTKTAAARRQQVYLSLVHWYEAAKFMPHKPELRDAALFSPTIKEVRKFARTRQDIWRSDWPVTRHSVLIAGLGMLTLQRPDLDLRAASLATIKAGLEPMQLPERFVDTCLERFDLWRQAPRVCVFGADVAPASAVGARLSKLVAPMPNWTLVTTCNRRTPWRVHDWALAHYIPVHYLGTPSERASRPLAMAVIEASDQVVVFEERKQKRFDHVLQAAKSLKRKIALELYDSGAESAGQLTIA